MAEETKTQAGVAPSSEKTGTPQTFTKADVDKVVRDTRSAALAEAGKFRAESANSLKLAQEAQARLDKMIKEQDERELEDARDDPQRLSALQERQRRRVVESELSAVKSELTQKGERLQQLETEKAETQREQTVQEVAGRYKVDPVRLAKLAKRTDGTIEEIEDLAKELPGANSKSLKPDSNRAVGGALGREQIIADYTKDPRNLANRERYFELRRSEGR